MFYYLLLWPEAECRRQGLILASEWCTDSEVPASRFYPFVAINFFTRALFIFMYWGVRFSSATPTFCFRPFIDLVSYNTPYKKTCKVQAVENYFVVSCISCSMLRDGHDQDSTPVISQFTVVETASHSLKWCTNSCKSNSIAIYGVSRYTYSSSSVTVSLRARYCW